MFASNTVEILTRVLDAFDYYLFHFCIHGMKNLHKVSQAALNVNNENSKTVYFCLAADYLCNFLPSDPNSQIYPQIECSPHQLPQPATILPANINPTKPTKYLLTSALSHQIQSPSSARTDLRMPDNARSSNWRSESVMVC